jgi:hypothetical protein
MRLRKVVNRVYEGKTYYRWIVSVPPKRIGDLGWVNGQELEATVRESGLWIHAAPRVRSGKRPSGLKELEDVIRQRSTARP